MKDLRLSFVDAFDDDEEQPENEKTRLAGLISEEFSDQREIAELETRIEEERKLRVMFSRRFEEASHRVRELEQSLADRSAELHRVSDFLQTTEGRLSEAQRSLEAWELESSVSGVGPAPEDLQQEVEELRKARSELEERVAELVSERDRFDGEDPEGRAARLRTQLDQKVEEMGKLEDELIDLRGELEMRMAVHEGLRQDFAGAEELRKRCERLVEENADIRDHLSSTLARLDMMEDSAGLQNLLDHESQRAARAESERDELRAALERARDQAHEAQAEARALQKEVEQAPSAPSGDPDAELRWKAASGVFLALFLYQSLFGGGGAPAPRPRPPPPTRSVEKPRRVLEPEQAGRLEEAALAALARRSAGLPVAPPPRVALRGDLEELPSLQARIARGELLEPTLERWTEVVGSSTLEARRASHLLARIYHALGRTAEARAQLDIALALDPRVADLHALFGTLQLQADDLGAAEESFRVAIGLDAGCAAAHGGLARVLSLMGKDQESRGFLQTALELDPENPDLHFDMAMALRTEASFEEAAEHLERFLERRPDDAYGHWFLAECYQHLGREREATEAKMKAYKLGYQDEEGLGDAPPDSVPEAVPGSSGG